jgi:ankyrin repeat protein
MTLFAAGSRHHSPAMKSLALLIAFAFPLLVYGADAPTAPEAKPLRQLLQQGLFEEEANRDLDKAAAAYAELVTQYDAQRAFAATALFRLAEIRAKQGNKAEAIALHQRLLAEFPTHDSLAKLSRERLAALGAPAEERKPNSLSPEYAARLQDQLATLRVELASRTQQLRPQHPVLANLRNEIQKIEALLHPEPEIPTTDDESKELAHVREMAKNSPDLINAVTVKLVGMPGETPLSFAAMNGWTQVATFLLDHGAQVNGVPDSVVPLHIAAGQGHMRMVELLLARGAEVDRRNPHQETALIAASASGRIEVVRLLLERGADPKLADKDGRTALHLARAAKSLEIAQMLLEKGADPNALSGFVRFGPEGSPLHQAVTARQSEFVRLLLDHRADPDAHLPEQDTPLMSAAENSDEELVKVLLAHGAKPDLAGHNGNTALHTAASIRAPAIVALLLEHGVPPNAANVRGATPFQLARIYEESTTKMIGDHRQAVPPVTAEELAQLLAVWKALADKGAGLNLRDGNGMTPLHYAIRNTRLPEEAALWLIEHGADLQIKDQNGNTPINVAAGRRQLFFEKRFVFPKLARERAITHVARYALDPKALARIASVADFEAPPALPEILRESYRDYFGLPEPVELVIYRAAEGDSVAEALRLPLLTLTGDDPAKWPTLRWGDVIVIEGGEEPLPGTIGLALSSPGWNKTRAEYDLPPHKARRVTLQVGERSGEFEIGEKKLDFNDPSIQRGPNGSRWIGAEDNTLPNVWNPTTPLPRWTFSELLTRAVAAEPRAQIEAVKVQRTVEGQTQEWTVDMRGEGGVKDIPARLGDGDRIIMPLRAANNADAIARRRLGIFQTAPGRLLGQRVFEWKQKDNTARTLGEFLMQSYLAGEMIVPAPDLSKIALHRLKGDSGEEETLRIDFTKATAAVSNATTYEQARALDVPLRWGDVVEIASGPGNAESWTGLSAQTLLFFDKALSRVAHVSVNGADGTTVVLSPGRPQFSFGQREKTESATFSLVRVLEKAKVNLKEIVRVKVRTGHDVFDLSPEEIRAVERGETLHRVVPFREFTPEEILAIQPWMRDGDSVEIERL